MSAFKFAIIILGLLIGLTYLLIVINRRCKFHLIKSRLKQRGIAENVLNGCQNQNSLEVYIQRLRPLVSYYTGISEDNISLDDDIMCDLGLEFQSSDAMPALVVGVEREFGVKLSMAFEGKPMTIRKLAEFIDFQLADREMR